MYRLMSVFGLTIDPFTNSPIMILKETEGEKSLPIWIGLLEATAIASELENVQFARPMTHDLLKSILEQMGATVSKVEVCNLKNNTFYALIHLLSGERTMTIDARPSDAIALALRTDSPIFVADEVIEQSLKTAVAKKEDEPKDDTARWTDILENLKPEDFGKYKM
ncbi:MAG: bifunctional nuclease family protein [Pseudomonadota bacterium]